MGTIADNVIATLRANGVTRAYGCLLYTSDAADE